MILVRLFTLALGLAVVAVVHAQPAPSYVIDELYSNADGSVQYIVLREAQGQANQHAFAGRRLGVMRAGGAVVEYAFPQDLPSTTTANTRVLLGSVGFQALGVVTPDYVIPDRFVPTEGGRIILIGGDSLNFAPLPTEGVLARFRDGTDRANIAMNFAGQSGAVTAAPVTVVEYYHAALDHYFVTPLAAEIDALDSGRQPGWARTGRRFSAWPSMAASGAGGSPVCRFYIPPDKGSSHFFSASPSECADVVSRTLTDPNFAGYVHETASAFYIALPNPTTGACAPGTVPVYRLLNGRADSNHRYTIDRSVRDEMVARGYAAEGYGPDPVAMCAPIAAGDSVAKVSDTSPFAAGCSPLNGTLYANSEVEPYLAVNPTNTANLIGVWQQDRWSNGGARGPGTVFSFDGGHTWERRIVPFTRCAGGNAGNGGDYERASDPWITFGPDGNAYQIALAITGATFATGSVNAITVSRSSDGGRTWTNPHALIVDGGDFFNDKEAITADPTDARFVYASWDRLNRTGGGPAYFSRTTDGGATWEAARAIHDPGANAQTLNNIPVVLPDGTLINFFTRLIVVNGLNVGTLQLVRSADKGVNWSAPITISAMQSIGVRDPETGTRVRDAAILGSIAVGRNGQLAVAWQDARFNSGARDAIALSRSLDGGLTWSAPVRVNRDLSVQAFVPTVAIRDDGTIGVSYYDFRSNTPSATELGTDYWIAQSTDGITWRETRLDGPFDLAIAPLAEGLFIGDYMSLVPRGPEFVAFYGRTNTRNSENRSDIAIGFVSAPGVAAKSDVGFEDDPMVYRTEAKAAMSMTEALAKRFDTAIRSAMQQRVPGWISPANPAGTLRLER